MKNKLFILILFLLLLTGITPSKIFAQTAPSIIGNCGGPTNQTIVPGVNVSWGYIYGNIVYWSQIEQTRNVFNWTALDQYVASVPDNKKVWLEVVTNWPTCGTPSTIPQWALDAGMHQFPDELCKNRPVQWDPLYLTFLEEALKAMDLKYKNNPKVEAYLMMSGGDWGEMSLPGNCAASVGDPNNIYVKEMARVYNKPPLEMTQPCNGYTYCFDYYFVESVKKIIKLYADTFTKPVVLQLGNGLSCQGIVAEKAAEYAVNTYGNKVWLKQNGWGDDPTTGTYFTLFTKYKTKTRIIEEAGHMQNVCSKDLEWAEANSCKCKNGSRLKSCCVCRWETQQEAINWANYIVGEAIGGGTPKNAGVSAICFYDRDVLSSNTQASQDLQKYPIQWKPFYDGLLKNYNELYLKQPTQPPGTPGATTNPVPTINPNWIKVATLNFTAKSGVSGTALLDFRLDPQSKVVEKSIALDTASDILGTLTPFSIAIGGGGTGGTPVISFKVKFRDVPTENAQNYPQQKVIVRVKKGTSLWEYTDVPLIHTGEDGNFASETVPLSGVPPGSGYSIIIKGPKHLGKAFRNLTLIKGDNPTFYWNQQETDALEPGDTPPQDGKINSVDISRIVELLEVAKPTQEQLDVADFNYDGVINGADMNELLLTLGTKFEDDN